MNINITSTETVSHPYNGKVSSKDIVIGKPKPFAFNTNLEGALWWYSFGYRVIPMAPSQKKPAVHHYPWLSDLSEEAIRKHWQRHPTHEVGAILDDAQLLLDADAPEAEEALQRLEAQFGVVPSLVIKTRRGHHHHIRLKEGVFAKPDSHHTADLPDRIDVRAQNNSVLLTPSTGKTVERLDVGHQLEMVPVGQDFVDAVFQHNGRRPPRQLQEVAAESTFARAIPLEMARLAELVHALDPDCGYQDWIQVLMAIYHETGGSDDGLELAITWSSKGGSFKGRAEIEAKWRSFAGEIARPVTVATLIARARAAGADTNAIVDEDFAKCETVVITPAQPREEKPLAAGGKANPLTSFSLRGQTAKYEAIAEAATPLLGEVCYNGEATVWYARHNTGKTLLFLHLASEAIEQKRLDPTKLFFINADDSSAGIAVKLGITDELGAHTLVPGQNGFDPAKLEALLLQAVQNDTARGTLVVIDTMKKFVDLMHKRQASDFANVCRQYVAAGGTLLGLAHVNKRRSEEGKAIHAGTSDILDDFDAGYLIDELNLTGQPGQRFVEFTRLKSRGGGVAQVAYTYAAEDHVSYAERLASVRLVDQDDLDGLRQVETERSDAEMIAVIAGLITAGINTKIALRNAVAEEANISRRAATKVIERYMGADPVQHRWNFVRKARGAKTFALLAEAESNPPEP